MAIKMKGAALWLCAAVLSLGSCDKSDPASTTPDDGKSATPTATPETSIHGEEVRYSAGGVEFLGYLAYDDKAQGPRPGILIVHEWWGHNEYVRERARMLAKAGYTAFALDMFGAGKLAKHPDEAKAFVGEVFSNLEAAGARFQAAQTLLIEHPTTDDAKISAIGYCFGGGVVLHMARTGADLDGVASFHGALATQSPAKPGGVVAKVLALHGDADAMVSAEQAQAFQDEMHAAGVDLKFVAYPGAKHGFTVPEATAVGEKLGIPLAYDEAADHQSWQELIDFLHRLYP